ncbi:transcription antitermination factor NusB [Ferrovum sp. PN-J185]|uniref:transcription antitermination factor NusB n=1 Tax=Ferrovum sp. PN-J185 TaxID=1356306 RepID=UPI0007970CD6|nr:transcription antitermination factor NusB [Ferrovum sp. PN-J185]KXW56360.1 N utilization substance protein B [Ferrovum sp. PN-J185]MCC6069084.1 transcription antitermination factor NusB [Ferrovum sp. PN-J185]
MKSARRLAREGVVQGLYSWQMTGDTMAHISQHILSQNHMARADMPLMKSYLQGIHDAIEELNVFVAPYLDRDLDSVSPIEKSILWLAAYELRHSLDTPFRVIINEAVEIAKSFGATDGHKYINGVIDKMALDVRPKEVKLIKG